MTHYYRNGTADECKGTWKNMFTCLRASMMDEEKRAVRCLPSTIEHLRFPITTLTLIMMLAIREQEYLRGTALDPTKPPHNAEPLVLKETPGW